MQLYMQIYTIMRLRSTLCMQDLHNNDYIVQHNSATHVGLASHYLLPGSEHCYSSDTVEGFGVTLIGVLSTAITVAYVISYFTLICCTVNVWVSCCLGLVGFTTVLVYLVLMILQSLGSFTIIYLCASNVAIIILCSLAKILLFRLISNYTGRRRLCIHIIILCCCLAFYFIFPTLILVFTLLRPAPNIPETWEDLRYCQRIFVDYSIFMSLQIAVNTTVHLTLFYIVYKYSVLYALTPVPKEAKKKDYHPLVEEPPHSTSPTHSKVQL